MKESDVTLCGHGSGRPRTIRMDVYLSARYAQKVTKGGKTWSKGLVAVVRPKRITEALRTAYHDKYSTIIGRNYYSQARRGYCYTRYPDGLYYSDCSSSQNLTFAAIGMDMPDYNTEAMYQSSRYVKVDVKIKDGHIINPEVLRVGDQLLFAGADPSRELHIGHVEGVFAIRGGTNDTVEDYQKFMNNNYRRILTTAGIEPLTIDGEYGPLTRAASVAVWKYMCNKYYGTDLTIGNENFYGASKQAAEEITTAEVAKHPTFGYILNGVLSGRGFCRVYAGTITPATRDGIIAAQAKASIPQTGRLSADLWHFLFN